MNLHDAYSALGIKQSGDTLISAKVCSRCQRRVTEYRFTASDGFSIATYHYSEHGDVIPTRGIGMHDNLPPRYS
jgi:hypothetical protein